MLPEQLRDAKALRHSEIRTRLAPIPLGASIRVIWRSLHGQTFEWFGTLHPAEGSSRAPRWTVTFFADADGPLTADDDTTLVQESTILPPSADDGVEILHISPVEPNRANHLVQSPGFPELHSESLDDGNMPHSDAARITPTADVIGVHRQVSSYTRVPDVGEVDEATILAAWQPAPPLAPGVLLRGVSTVISGGDFLAMTSGLLDHVEAKRRAAPIVWAAVVESVRRSHITAVADLRQYIIAHGDNAARVPLDILVAMFLEFQRISRSWRWTTLNRVASNMIGAFVALPVYAPHAPSINAAAWPHLHALLQTAKRLATAQGHREPVLCTASHVIAALAQTNSQRVRALLALCWVTAQRPCDILNMKPQHVSISPSGELSIKIVAGKTAGSLGAHHIHSSVRHPAMLEAIQSWLQHCKYGYVFPIGSPYQRAIVMRELLSALRAVDPSLESRSLRRGTLCCMAAAGASDAELLKWSRHTTKEALQRYLYDEKIPQAEHQLMQRLASSALLPAPPPVIRGGGPVFDISRVSDGLITCHPDGSTTISHERAPKPPPALATECLPLYVLPQAAFPASLERLNEMAAQAPADVRDAWLHDVETLYNRDGRYDAIPFDGTIYEATIPEEGVLRQLAAGIIAEVTDLRKITGSVRVFPVQEPHKGRSRCITHTQAFNDRYDKADVAPNRGNALQSDALADVLGSEGAILIDFSCFFDFFEQDDSVSYNECFRACGRVYRRKRLAMGKRSATSVATSATKVLLSFPRPDSVKVRFATDGARFAGCLHECAAAAYTFAKRAHYAGFHSNDIDLEACTRDDIAALWRTKEADFLGQVIDFERKSVHCRARHVTRLRDFANAALCPGAAFHDQVRLWSMCLYMLRTLGIPKTSFYASRVFFAHLSRRLAIAPVLWHRTADAPMPLEVLRAVEICCRNFPARIVPAPIVDCVSIVDSCAVGYASITVRPSPDGLLRATLHQRRWDLTTRRALNLELSTNTEPEGIARVTEHTGSAGHLVLSDHDGFVDAFAAGSSPSPVYNSRLQRCCRAGLVALVFTPGDSMLADAYSRFVKTVLSPEDALAAQAIATHYLGHSVGLPFRVVGMFSRRSPEAV
jgi:integrase